MVRPTKPRQIEQMPEITYFKPAGVPMKELEEMVITIEELEALRLKDSKGLNQHEAAIKMNISRPTFQRILITARSKVSRALTEGMAIRIQGGTYHMTKGRFQCRRCGDRMESGKGNCPRCKTRSSKNM